MWASICSTELCCLCSLAWCTLRRSGSGNGTSCSSWPPVSLALTSAKTATRAEGKPSRKHVSHTYAQNATCVTYIWKEKICIYLYHLWAVSKMSLWITWCIMLLKYTVLKAYTVHIRMPRWAKAITVRNMNKTEQSNRYKSLWVSETEMTAYLSRDLMRTHGVHFCSVLSAGTSPSRSRVPF